MLNTPTFLRLGTKHKRGYEFVSEPYNESSTSRLPRLSASLGASPSKHDAPYVEQLPSELSLDHIASLPLPEEKNGKAHANGRK